jgi:hypothetical protein
VLDERAALAQRDYGEWVASEIRAAPKDGWDKPESSSPRLRKWFDDMRKTFPRDTHPDDPYRYGVLLLPECHRRDLRKFGRGGGNLRGLATRREAWRASPAAY